MHVEHIWPRSRGGALTLDNLCFACAWCNSYKGTQTHASILKVKRKFVSFILAPMCGVATLHGVRPGYVFWESAPSGMQRWRLFT